MGEIKIERVGDRFLLYEGGGRIGELKSTSVMITPAPPGGKYTIRYQLPGKAETVITANTPGDVEKYKVEILRRGGTLLAVTGGSRSY